MSFGPITPAQIDFSDPAAPRAPAFGDTYHPRAGAPGQAAHVFLAGNGLPQRWGGRARFVVLETGFGLGGNFLATWQAWRADPRRCDALWFVSIEKHPPTRHDLAQAYSGHGDDPLVDQLVRAWPPLTPDLHALAFEDGRVRLLLAFGDIARVMPELCLQADAIYLDGFAPDRNPTMWDESALGRLPRLAAPGATLATWSVARPLHDRLATLGFEVRKVPGFGGKREMTVARFAPRFAAPPPPGRRAAATVRHVAVVGGGLAGGGVAAALARQGVQVTVLDRASRPAQAASGNPAGLVHGVLHGDDGVHERWYRAAALHAQRSLGPLIGCGAVAGHLHGLLRVETTLPLGAMRRRLADRRMPADYVQAVTPGEGSALAGGHLAAPAWFYPGGGWASPAGMVHAAMASPGVRWQGDADVAALHPTDHGWRVADAAGMVWAEADAVVWAVGTPMPPPAPTRHAWPLSPVRGQITLLPASRHGLGALQRPVAGQGYAIRLPDGELLCGATTQSDDPDDHVREDDHRSNLERLAALLGGSAGPEALAAASGRVGWRVVSPDRMPVVGPWPADATPARRRDQPRLWARQDGLYVATAFGSRGIAQSGLVGELLAAWITGAPWPVPASLVDAMDVARFAARSARRQLGHDGPAAASD